MVLALSLGLISVSLLLSYFDLSRSYKEFKDLEKRDYPTVDWYKSKLDYAGKVSSIRNAKHDTKLTPIDYEILSRAVDPDNAVAEFYKLRSLTIDDFFNKDIKVNQTEDLLEIKIYNAETISEIVKTLNKACKKSQFSIYKEEYLYEALKDIGDGYYNQSRKVMISQEWFPTLNSLVFQLYLLYPHDLALDEIKIRLGRLKNLCEMVLSNASSYDALAPAWYLSSQVSGAIDKMPDDKKELLNTEYRYFKDLSLAFHTFGQKNMEIRRANWYKIADYSNNAFIDNPVYMSENLDELVKPGRLMEYSNNDRLVNYIPVALILVILILLLPFFYRPTEAVNSKFLNLKDLAIISGIPILLLFLFSFLQTYLPYREIHYHWAEYSFYLEKIIVYSLFLFVPLYFLLKSLKESSEPLLKKRTIIIISVIFFAPLALAMFKRQPGNTDFQLVIMGTYVVQGILMALICLVRYFKALIKQDLSVKVKERLPMVILFYSIFAFALVINGVFIQRSFELKHAKEDNLSRFEMKDNRAWHSLRDESMALFRKVYESKDFIKPKVNKSRYSQEPKKLIIKLMTAEDIEKEKLEAEKEERDTSRRGRRSLRR